MYIKFNRLHPDAVFPKYATELAAGFDLVAAEDVIIEPNETKLVPLGFAVQIPEGYEMQIRPRSGVTSKTKIRVGNAPGTIDADYIGEVKVIVDNIATPLEIRGDYNYLAKTIEGSRCRADTLTEGNTCDRGTYIIRKGDRIAQGVIAPVYRAEFIEVDALDDTKRGAGGFGHTEVTA